MRTQIDEAASKFLNHLRTSGRWSATACDLLGAMAAEGFQPSLELVREIVADRIRYGAAWQLPEAVVEVAREILKIRAVRSMLDPECGYGEFLVQLAQEVDVDRIVGISANRDWVGLAEVIGPEGAEWHASDPMAWLASCTERFGAVVSMPPIGVAPVSVREVWPAGGYDFRAPRGDLVLLLSALLLDEEGVGLYVVPASFLSLTPSANVRKALGDNGIHANAFLKLPSNAVRWTSIELGLVVVSRRPTDTVWVGEIPTDERRQRAFVSNLLAHQRGADAGLGRLVAHGDFRSFASTEMQERIVRLAQRSRVREVLLSEVALGVHRARARGPALFDDYSNAFFLPSFPTSQAVLALDESTVQPRRNFQVVLDPDKATAAYVVRYYNSQLGKLVRGSLASGNFIPEVRLDALRNSSLHLPPIEAQRRVVDADLRLGELLNELTEMRDRLFAQPSDVGAVEQGLAALNRPERLTDWIDTLPFPLASILWTYHTSENVLARPKHLLHFFEALSEFLAVVLLSACRSDPDLFDTEWQAAREALDDQHLSVMRATFGCWVLVASRLAKRLRALLNGNDGERAQALRLFCTADREPVERLLSKAIIGALQTANGIRNDYDGHGGVLGDAMAHSLHQRLDGLLQEVRGAMGLAWGSFELVRGDTARVRSGAYYNSAQRIMGSRTPFERLELPLEHALEEDCLYLHAPAERRALRLIPFVQILASPQTAENACYFYNRTEGDGRIRVVSYHFAPEAARTEEFGDISAFLCSLLWSGGS
ncbi:MAG: hypothetical protein HYU66_11275 [Armatimonadetes bacterium]|nr:hypothetical protein [Armatimonadota bacterium]